MSNFKITRHKLVEEEPNQTDWRVEDELHEMDYEEPDDRPVPETEFLDRWEYYGHSFNNKYTEHTWLGRLPLLIGRLVNRLARNEEVSPLCINYITIGPRLLFIFESLPGIVIHDGSHYLNNRYIIYIDNDLTDDYIILGSQTNPNMGYIEVRGLE